MTDIPKCGECGISGVRLYRQYGTFRRPQTDRCNSHIPNDEMRGWYVPLVLDAAGEAWGYTSAPDADIATFNALADADPNGLKWARGEWR